MGDGEALSAQRIGRVLGLRLGGAILATVGLAASHSVADVYKRPLEVETVEFEGGCFMLGSDNYYPEEAPETRECVEPFALMTKEVSYAQFSEFVNSTGYQTRAERGWSASDADGPGVDLPPGSAVFMPNPKVQPSHLNWWKFIEGANWKQPLGADQTYRPEQQSPVVHITRDDAEAFATWAGGRLPSEAEWEFAATHTLDGRKTGAIKEDEPKPLKANTWQGVFPIINTNEDGYNGVAPVGSYPPDANGVYDLIGNVWEWTTSPYSSNHTERARTQAAIHGYDPSQPGVPVGTIKGGSFLCAESYCFRFRPTARQSQDLAFGTSHIGFRVVFESRSK